MAKGPTLTERLEVVEAAVGSALGINLSEFDSTATKSAYVEAVAKAALDISEMVKEADREKALDKAAKEIGKPLSDQERLERLEAAFKAGGVLE